MDIKTAKLACKRINDLWDNFSEQELNELSSLMGVEPDFLKSEMFPPDPTVIIGDWLLSTFSIEKFLDQSLITEFYNMMGDELQEVLFYANIPDGQTILHRVKTIQENIENGDIPDFEITDT
jgi:hypothetical protein